MLMSVTTVLRVVRMQSALTMKVAMTVTVLLGTLETDWCAKVSGEMRERKKRDNVEKGCLSDSIHCFGW